MVVKLGAMGDVIHTLPAVASLKHSFPRSRLSWVISPQWAPLIVGNPFVDEVILLDRATLRGLGAAARKLRGRRWSFAVDFQGLVQSALVAAVAWPEKIFGFDRSQAREKSAAWFYSTRTVTHSPHRVDQNLELAAAAGASSLLTAFPIPPGMDEGELPEARFVLANPLAGWAGKQWPHENYARLARGLNERFGATLVLNGTPQSAALVAGIPGVHTHISSLAGLIAATRRAAAVVGVDSGPLHLAAALGKPGVAIFGPTDPARNGPYGKSMAVLRDPRAETTYKRRDEPEDSMRAISVEAVLEALRPCLAGKTESAGRPL